MESTIVFNKDYKAATIFVMNIYHTDVSVLWDYFTKAELTDQWWAPKPWRAETSVLDFREGGKWQYAMVGPNNEKHYSGAHFLEIHKNRSISLTDFFTDENGNINNELPSVNWLIGFTGVEEGTKLTVNIHFQSEESMKQLLEMGFEEGFKTGLTQLEEIINKKD